MNGKLWGRWHHQLTHLHIHTDWSRNVSWKFAKLQNFITSLFFNRFSSGFHCSVQKNFTLSSEIKLDQLRTSPLSIFFPSHISFSPSFPSWLSNPSSNNLQAIVATWLPTPFPYKTNKLSIFPLVCYLSIHLNVFSFITPLPSPYFCFLSHRVCPLSSLWISPH